MKQLDLSFKINKQYENWQFELDALDDRLSGYHSYKYIGKQLNYFLNFITHKTELIFNGDILTAVIITIKHADIVQLNSINQFLVNNTSKVTVIEEYTRTIKAKRITYLTKYNPKNKQIIIIYGKARFMQKHLLFLSIV